MANHTPAHRRSGLDFAQRIAQLATKAPDDVSKKAAYSTANWLRRYYGLSDEQKQSHILAALAAGCSNYDDLVEETKMNRPDIIRIIKNLETSGDIEIKRLVVGDRRGKPPIYICLVNKISDK